MDEDDPLIDDVLLIHPYKAIMWFQVSSKPRAILVLRRTCNRLTHMGVSINQNSWLIVENLTKMDDLGGTPKTFIEKLVEQPIIFPRRMAP